MIWRKIPNLPNGRYYEVNEYGKVRNGHTHKVLATSITNSGYERIILGSKYQGKVVWRYIHRAVVEAFIGPMESKMDVNHIDGNKLNNRLDNLEVCTRSQNKKHAYKFLGVKPHNVKLTPYEACRARKIVKGGKSQASVARLLGVSNMVMSRLCRQIQKEYKCVCNHC